jgi:hypothetical protein
VKQQELAEFARMAAKNRKQELNSRTKRHRPPAAASPAATTVIPEPAAR